MYDEMGDRQGLTQIEQLQGKKEVRVGVYNPTLETVNRILWENNTSVIWIGRCPYASSRHSLYIGMMLCSSNAFVSYKTRDISI